MIRTSASVLLVLITAAGLPAQTGAPPLPRLSLVPQYGAAFNHSKGAGGAFMASLVAEVPLTRAVALTAEATAATQGEPTWACPALPGGECVIPAELRSTAAAGLVARPLGSARIAPYAGVAGGMARWAREEESGLAPLAVARAGLDVQVSGPVGIRAEVVRRVAWTGTPHGNPLHADYVSLGARFAIRR